MLAAIRNPLLYWDIESQGYCAMTDDKANNKWISQPNKEHAYLIEKGNAKEITQLIDNLMSDVPYPFSNKEKLVANWKFDEDDTFVVEDASEKNHTGIFIGNPSWVKGKYGNAVNFSDAKGIMFVDKSNDFVFHLRFGFAFWIYYPDAIPEGNQMLLKHISDRNEFITINKNEENKIAFFIKKGGLTGKTKLTPNKWHHIAISQKGASTSIYIDGVLDVEANIDISEIWGSQEPGPFYLGANVDGKEASNTYIDDLFIFNDALTQEDVQEIMNKR